MTDRPDAFALLAVARETLLDRILPQLPGSAHYEARMIANAMAIAARELAAEPMPADLRRELVSLAGTSADANDDALAAALAARMRSGAFDGDGETRASLHKALVLWTAARLAVSNPKAVER